jgi:hypothetical protein
MAPLARPALKGQPDRKVLQVQQVRKVSLVRPDQQGRPGWLERRDSQRPG